MKALVCVAGLLSALVMLAPTDADAKKRKSKKSPQVAGFLMTSDKGNSGLLRGVERERQHDRVAGNDNVARFFFYLDSRGSN